MVFSLALYRVSGFFLSRGGMFRSVGRELSHTKKEIVFVHNTLWVGAEQYLLDICMILVSVSQSILRRDLGSTSGQLKIATRPQHSSGCGLRGAAGV